MATESHRQVGEQSSISDFTDQVNSRLEVLYGQLNNTLLPDFGSTMLCYSSDIMVAATVAHRFLKKFQKPIPGRADELHEKCVADWLLAEENFKSFSWSRVPLKSKSVLYRARVLLADWLATFKRGDCVEFTPGETLVSAQGRVSAYQKLRRKESWTVTYDAFEDFACLVYNTRWLKKVAKTFLHPLTHEQNKKIYELCKHNKHVGFSVFRHRFLTEVVTLVHGGRFASVEKDNSKRRAIIVAPLGNMLLQRTVAHPLREILVGVGNSLETGQELHKERISRPGYSTVDFSNASDSNLLEVINGQFPGKVACLLRRYRDPMVYVEGNYVLPLKLSSMGCGFTFEVMTLLLLSIARVLDPTATVYGDDVIISDDHAAQFIEVTRDIMWNVNEKKTFIAAPFRESCGAFFLDGYGYITCFDFHWCENHNEAMIAVNKLKMIADSDIPIIGGLFRSAYEACLRCAPALSLGTRAHQVGPDLGFIDVERASRKQKRSKRCQIVWKKYEGRIAELCERFCWDFTEATLVEKPVFVNDMASKTDRICYDSPRIAYYLYTGMVSNDPIRNSGEWRSRLVVTTPQGECSVNLTKKEQKEVARIREREHNRLHLQLLWIFFSFHCQLVRRGRLPPEFDYSHNQK